ncbi:Armadillo-like helical [Penicillium canariense]|uniref:Armadillo-like helical n=1 Tax=Penicillium canariense TaxID=189055 RepID=A0A9W9IFU7_9EURO|nr:Armadillo-like helical [Penicillium canariense]KAJ5176460.1 Armadillo-like helical [Penicillium canariense]
MATLAGPSMLARMNKEGRFLAHDGGVDVRDLSFGRHASGYQHSSSRHSHSDPDEVSQYGNTQNPSGGDVEVPSNKKPKLGHVKVESAVGQTSQLEKILANLSPKAPSGFRADSDHPSRSSRMTSSNDTFPAADTAGISNGYSQDNKMVELIRLKQELLAANSKIALQEQELAQNRVIKHTLDQALGPPSEAETGSREITEQTINSLQNAFNASNPSFGQFQDTWNSQEDSRSDVSDALSSGAYSRARGLWSQNGQPSFGISTQDPAFDKIYGELLQGAHPVAQDSGRFWGTSPVCPAAFAPPGAFPPHRILSGPSNSGYGFYQRPPGEQSRSFQAPNPGPRRSLTQGGRGGPIFSAQSTTWSSLNSGPPSDPAPKSPVSPTRSSSAFQPFGMYPVPYHARPGATTLSPTASEFTTANSNVPPWASSPNGGSSMQTYLSPLEPLNYRRLLDKNVSCDWKYIVDKIVCNNDQQASIFLQQKLKVGTSEQKFDIIQAIVSQAYPLMINRFGNFLVQRCFEHGTPEQIVAIAHAIRGNTLSLSMDPFGCHVIQKAFDCVPEEHKAVMVHELLRRIPETVIHRYSCHVWQKLFELRWSGEPPQIMAKVNEALDGMWHEVALGETGSLVVQNIFENCVEEEKRPAIEEVLGKVDVLAHGQFGNWCIQHICEHGAPHDKSRAIEHVLHYAVDYSMDQFASKIVEKCLKIGGTEFLDRYLSRVCTGRADRPRMPLIDIAGDQYGNYLIQWVLVNAAPHQRELVASHIRKHMVSLRGSKFGSRVAMLCCNPSHATRPGPGTGMQVGRFNHFNEDRFPSGASNGGRFTRGNQWSSGPFH